jgi:hypothetical protein
VVEKNSKLFSYLFQSTFFRGTETQQASQQEGDTKEKRIAKKKKRNGSVARRSSKRNCKLTIAKTWKRSLVRS